MGVDVGLLPVLPFGSAKVGLRTAAANSAEEIGVVSFFMGVSGPAVLGNKPGPILSAQCDQTMTAWLNSPCGSFRIELAKLGYCMGDSMRASAALAVLTLSCLSGASLAGSSALSALGMEHFRDTATVADDPAANLTTISTERGYVEGSGPMREVWHDEFLVATIGHATGQRSFHIEVSTTYSGSRRSYRDADLEAMAGPKSV